jgi:hypothetical protein
MFEWAMSMGKMPLHMPQSCGGLQFRRSRTSLQDDPWSGRPADSVNEENCQAVENVVLQNRPIKCIR